MSLKLWHQSTTEMSRESPYGKALVRRAQEVLGDSVVLDTFGLPAGTYRGRGVSAANSNAFVYHRILDRVIDNAIRAEREGYDAFIIGSYSEPFLKETRAAVNIPVLSLFETTLLVGCSLGTRTAFITTSPPVVDMINKSVSFHRMADRVGDVVSLEPAFEGPALHAAFNDPSRLIASFERSAIKALENGADVLVPAEGIIAVILTKGGSDTVQGRTGDRRVRRDMELCRDVRKSPQDCRHERHAARLVRATRSRTDPVARTITGSACVPRWSARGLAMAPVGAGTCAVSNCGRRISTASTGDVLQTLPNLSCLGYFHGWLLTGIASFAIWCRLAMAGSSPAMTGSALFHDGVGAWP
jgi:allantoin racemase